MQNLIITFAVNTTCGILKDKAYIQHFGAVQSKSFPASSLLLLFLRDIITVASAFTLPPIFGRMLEEKLDLSERASRNIAQITSPLLVQIFVTPLHLLGLDLYNREGLKLKDRAPLIMKLYPNALTMRMIRFLPAYGIGGVLNTEIRKRFEE